MSTGRKIAIGLSLLICLPPAGLAGWLWLSCAMRPRSGSYPVDSYPVELQAKDLSWLTLFVWLAVAAAWGVYGVVRRSRR
jgi:hypothetical protein